MNGVELSIHLAAPREQVWEHLTDPDKLAAWLMESDLSYRRAPKPGAKFTFLSEPMGTWDGKVHCEIRAIAEPGLISYTWSANDIGAETLVTFELAEEDGGTRLTLRHTAFEGALPGAEGRHAAGWIRCLKELGTAICGPDSDYDWSEMQVTLFIEAPVDAVFRMWGTAAGMRSFWPDEIACTKPDGTARQAKQTFENGDRVVMTFPTRGSTELEIVSVEPNRFVTFRFGREYGWVNVRLSEEGGRTRVDLRQFGSPTAGENPWEIHANARGWWIANLMNMKSVLLHGKDLRVREPGAESGLSATYLPGGGTAPQPHDWRAFDLYLYIAAPREAVMNRWRSAAGLESFFIADAVFRDEVGDECGHDEPVQAGDAYTWRSIHDFKMKGSIIEASAERVAFTFGSHFRCEVGAVAQGGGTLLHLRQSGMRDKPEERLQGSLNCRCCWIYFLITLKSQLENGVDLRDHDPATADAISVNFNPRLPQGGARR